jgi:hypothetical protein
LYGHLCARPSPCSGVHVEQGTLQPLVTAQLTLVNSYFKDNVGPGGAHLSMRSRGALTVQNTTFELHTEGVQVRRHLYRVWVVPSKGWRLHTRPFPLLTLYPSSLQLPLPPLSLPLPSRRCQVPASAVVHLQQVLLIPQGTAASSHVHVLTHPPLSCMMKHQ